ncbi:MAG: electron transfer flavoprotein-ubiquinone oxidoreductase [Acidobacteria bacterium]|nr:electron transfer flavoprotein-ubiquinone oxidoreductase [Acidobacteriota bacterium]
MERETLDVDILVVGAGPAGLSAALRLSQLQQQQGGEPLAVAVIDKAREAGAHSLSGALLDPSTLAELIPDFAAKGAPLACEVTNDSVYLLGATNRYRLPLTPPPFTNHGNYVISLSHFVKWLAQQVESAGTDLFMGFAGQSVLYEGERVVGIRTSDRGVGKDGAPRGAVEPGSDIRAKVTIFADGVRGHLTKELTADLQLGSTYPAQFGIGLKELWDVPKDRLAPGTVIHTLGYPLRNEEFGGSWIYAMPEGRLSVGFVVGLDYKDPLLDPHQVFQRFKTHPFIRGILQDGQLVRFGAKALPEGGWNTQPTLYADGALIVGDAANFVNSMRLKGIHLAMRSGMLAAETAFEAVRRDDTTKSSLKAYKAAIDGSAVQRELYPVRNVHQAFGHGTLVGAAFAGLAMAIGGRWPEDLHGHPGHTRMRTVSDYYGLKKHDLLTPSNAVPADRVLTFDKATSVHFSGVHHEENQPPHLRVQTDVCHSICGPEFGHPCVKFCPANVYEMVDSGTGSKRLQLNASNCVHCKTCDIMDPYGVITWVAPEGGEGPQYDGM